MASGLVLESRRSSTGSLLSVPTETKMSLITANPRNKVSLKPGRSLIDWIRLGNSGKDLAGTGGKALAVTPEELAKHNKIDDCWICLKGQVYNVTSYLEFHPGGENELMRGAGIDATDLFNEMHKWVNFESMLKSCYVGKMVGGKLNRNSSISAMFEDDEKRNGVVPAKPKTVPPPTFVSPQPPSPVRMDWFQTDGYVCVTLYTKGNAKVNAEDVIIEYDEGSRNFHLRILISEKVFHIHYELCHEIESKFEVKLTKGDSVKIEVKLPKKTGDNWPQLGKELEYNNKLLPPEDEKSKFFACKLSAKTKVTHDTVLLKIEMPKGLRMLVPMGRHLYLKGLVEGTTISRPYTPVLSSLDCKESGDCSTVYLMIKIYPKGALSPVLDSIEVGGLIDASLYEGSFNSDLLIGKDDLVLLAAGTGFTPMVRLIHDQCIKNSTRNVNLCFFNRKEEDIMWKDQLDNLALSEPRFKVTYVLSNPDDTWTGHRGLVSKDLVETLFPKNVSRTLFCYCGPPLFGKACSGILNELRVQNKNRFAFEG